MRNTFKCLWIIGLLWSSTACVDAVEGTQAGNDVVELAAVTEELDGDARASLAEPLGSATLQVRYCDEEFDCNTACACISGTCQPDGFGPPPPAGYCEQPPQRACSSGSDCRSSCVCNGGTCQPDGFGPLPPPDYCAQPPPDAYEYNDGYTSATHYLGSPQTGHTFHERGDTDWVLVYFGSAMTATFETYNLSGSNTYLQVYVYNYTTGQLGSQVGANDDVCGYWWSPSCWASRVVVSVPANSVYAARITNTSDGGRTVYDQNAPRYNFRIY